MNHPILFFIFNRPDYARRVFEQIRIARPSKLFIVADGPRTQEEISLTDATRAAVERIDWPCEVERNYAERNLGLKKRISSGIDWFFERNEAGIILEDDCVPHQDFFRFADEMLERYKDEEKIMMISGDNFLPDFEIKESYAFSKYFPIWGWATWRRAWKKYDIEMQSWYRPGSRDFIKKAYSQKYMQKHLVKIFDEAHSGKLKSWDVQWLYACLMSDGLCIIPKSNLVSNVGVSGTHSEGHNQNLATRGIYMGEGLAHPGSLESALEYDRIFYERSFSPEPFDLRRMVISILVRYETIKKIYRSLRKLHSKFRGRERGYASMR